MAIVELKLYSTQIVRGIAQGDSTPVTLKINDATNDGIIDREDWSAYTGKVFGHIAGSTNPMALLDGTKTGKTDTGTLYTTTPYAKGDSIGELAKQLDHNKYGLAAPKLGPAAAELVICYLAGTLIATPDGEVPVETLRAGDLVLTRDHGPQPLVWTSISHIAPADLDVAPNQRPLRVAAGALGGGLPRRDVDLSPQHRILVTGADGQEYLISARHMMMAGAPGITLRPVQGDYQLVHIAFADHEIVLAEGAPMESFYTGKMAVRALSPAQRLSLALSFPDLATGGQPMTPARPFLRHRDYAAMLGDMAQAG